MSVRSKTTSILVPLLLSACDVDCPTFPPPPPPDTDGSTSDDGTPADSLTDGDTEPTTTAGMNGETVPVHVACFNGSNYQDTPAGNYVFPLMHSCAEILESEAWDSETNMEAILDACTKTCEKALGAPNNGCTNDGWNAVQLTGQPCDPNDYGPEYGGGIVWADGVQSTERQVACDLNSDCRDAFSADIAERLAPETRNSAPEDDSGAEHIEALQIDASAGTDRPLGLAGVFEYTLSHCGERACPLYLGSLDLEQSSTTWRMALDTGSLGRVDKTVSDLRVQLAAATLGIALSDGQVAFPAGALLLRVEAVLGGTAHPLIANGPVTFRVRNPTPIVGRIEDGALDLRLEIPTDFGSITVQTARGR